MREGTRFSLIITDRSGDAYGISWLNSHFRCCSVIEFAACQSARCICRAPRSMGCWDAVTWQHHGEISAQRDGPPCVLATRLYNCVFAMFCQFLSLVEVELCCFPSKEAACKAPRV